MASNVHEETCRVPTSAVDQAEEQLERPPSPSAQYLPPLLGPGPKGVYIGGGVGKQQHTSCSITPLVSNFLLK